MGPLGLLRPNSLAPVLLVAGGWGVWGVGHGMAPKLGVYLGALVGPPTSRILARPPSSTGGSGVLTRGLDIP
jgi:hypothetical protein